MTYRLQSANSYPTLGNSLNVVLRADYLSVRTAVGASDRRRLKARLVN